MRGAVDDAFVRKLLANISFERLVAREHSHLTRAEYIANSRRLADRARERRQWLLPAWRRYRRGIGDNQRIRGRVLMRLLSQPIGEGKRRRRWPVRNRVALQEIPPARIGKRGKRQAEQWAVRKNGQSAPLGREPPGNRDDEQRIEPPVRRCVVDVRLGDGRLHHTFERRSSHRDTRTLNLVPGLND